MDVGSYSCWLVGLHQRQCSSSHQPALVQADSFVSCFLISCTLGGFTSDEITTVPRVSEHS